MNFKGPAFNDNSVENPALDIISSVYFSQRSELYKKLVLNEKKLRYIRCGQSNNHDPNLISVDASVKKKDDLQYIKDEVMKTLEMIKTTPVDEKILNEAKSNIKYSIAMRLDNPGAIANSLAAYLAVSENPESINNYYAMFDKVTAEDVMSVAKKYFLTTGLTIGTVSADEDVAVK